MARPISTNLLPSIRWPKGLVAEVAPRELIYFKPPKGIDTQTPLDRVSREYSPFIQNLVLDRGVLRSRYGIETYHNNDAGTPIQLTTDLTSTASPTNPTITARTTANQGTAAGWTDPDGFSDGVNSISVATGSATVAAASRLRCFVGDPTADANVVSYNGQYVITFGLSASNTYTSAFARSDAYLDVEVSTDGGTTWTLALGNAGQLHLGPPGGGSISSTFTVGVTVPGSPAHVRFRLALSVTGVIAGGFGTASASVKVFNTTWLTDTYPVTWFTSATPLGVLGAKLPTRWTGTHMQMYTDPTDVAGPWTTVYTFPATQLNSDSTLPTYVTWQGTVVSADVGNAIQGGGGNPIGSKGLISTLLVSPYTTSILTHSPRAAHIAVFGNRIVASRTNDWTGPSDPWVTVVTNLSRVRWSVKNNSNDWDGLGSGFEDLLVPGGQTDEVMGVYPVSDQTAIIVSERSVRRMDITGFVDAPFAFSLLTQSIGTLSRYSICLIPGGVIFLSYDDVIIFTLDGPKRIGQPALRDSLKLITNPRLAYGYYDQYNSRYLVTFKEGSTQVVWAYSLIDQGWTKLQLPFDVVAIDRAYIPSTSGAATYGAYFTQAAVSGYSCRENPTRARDVDVNGVAVDSSIEIRTALILVDSPLRKTELVEVQLVYESTASQTLVFEYSTDGGSTWTVFSTQAIVATVEPTVLSVRQRVERSRLQLRVRSTTLGGLKLISLHAFAAPGAMIHA